MNLDLIHSMSKVLMNENESAAKSVYWYSLQIKIFTKMKELLKCCDEPGTKESIFSSSNWKAVTGYRAGYIQ